MSAYYPYINKADDDLSEEQRNIVNEEFLITAPKMLNVSKETVSKFLNGELEHLELATCYFRLEQDIAAMSYLLELSQVTQQFKKDNGL